jgi:hypothetical protein
MKSADSIVISSNPAATPADGTPSFASLTSGRLPANNAVWNLVEACAPVLVAVVCLPMLKKSLGMERLGIISLAWVLVGYFGFFDLGLSRALVTAAMWRWMLTSREKLALWSGLRGGNAFTG